jgi:hypothetical protein
MSSHTHRLMSNHTTLELPENHNNDALSRSPENGAFAIDANPKSPARAAEPALPGLDGAAPIAPSQRLPLIAHTLREARVGVAELRYEGRGGLGGFITEFHDRHRLKSLFQSVDERIAQQLTGFLWQLVLRRNPDWNENAGSFGIVTWDLKSDLIRHVHHERIVEVKTSLIEGL